MNHTLTHPSAVVARGGNTQVQRAKILYAEFDGDAFHSSEESIFAGEIYFGDILPGVPVA
jgi:hypothetical protein